MNFLAAGFFDYSLLSIFTYNVTSTYALEQYRVCAIVTQKKFRKILSLYAFLIL